MAKVLTPPKKKKKSELLDFAGDAYSGTRGIGSGKVLNRIGNPRRFSQENLQIPVGSASKTNKVRYKKPQPVIKKSTKKR